MAVRDQAGGVPDMISIIIKALNEEENIARAIKSALDALDGKGEVILADSLSTDKTVEIASRFDVKIVQLVDPKDRSCGMGAQLGYVYSKGDFVYILDGDMELDKGFLPAALKVLKEDASIAGVGGIITEMTQDSIIFNKRKKGEASKVDKPRYVGKLMMGGLYRRDAIEKAGYFSNPYLHAYEESDLGHRLTTAGYKLIRINVPMVKHYGDSRSSVKVTFDRWRSRYLWGCGEFLRYNFGKPTFCKVAWELKIYLATIVFWISFIICAALAFITPLPLIVVSVLGIIFLIVMMIRKRNISEFAFSLFSWNITAAGLISGFLTKPKDINKRINAKVIKGQ